MRHLVPVVVALFFLNNLYSLEIHKAKSTLICSIPSGSSTEALGFLSTSTDSDPEFIGPSDLVVLSQNRFVISDPVNRKVKAFTGNGKLIQELEVLARRLTSDGKCLIGWNGSGDGKVDLFAAKIEPNGLPGRPLLAKISTKSDSYLLVYPFLVSTESPEDDSSPLSWDLRNGAVLSVPFTQLLKENGEITFRNGVLASSVRGFIPATYDQLQSQENLPATVLLSGGKRGSLGGRFVGSDFENNLYFVDGFRWIYVLGKDLEPKAILEIHDRGSRQRSYSSPAVTEDGNVYFVESTATSSNIFRVAKSW